MYKIREEIDRERYILLIPAMLDAHFPLLKYAFYSKNYHPVILENEEMITDEGLKYVNNDMCYPAILNAGQIISALKSGSYDLERTMVLMPTAGDACRGSNYTSILRRAMNNAGFSMVKVLSLNLKGLEKTEQLRLDFGMVWRALFALYYGDLLMLLLNQTRPFEKQKGKAKECWERWIEHLSKDMKNGKNLSLRGMKQKFSQIAKDFADIELTGEKKQRVGIVGEIYIKYCHIGNWDLIRYLEQENCESHTNGLSWYAMYYMDSHLTDRLSLEGVAYRIGLKFFGRLQRQMVRAIRKFGFYTMEDFDTLKKEAQEYISFHNCIGDGWLIGAEIVGHILHDCPKVVAVQPFDCMPNHICGKGLYPSLSRKLLKGQIVSNDVDSSASKLNYYNRVQMLINC